MRRLVSFTLFVIFGFGALLVTAQGAEKAQVILVLDASGSMWQRVEKKEKILIAREVIGNMLKDWDTNTELGLIAYGHRRKGDCGDIETMVTPGPVDTQAIRGIVDRIKPKGKTPLSAAVMKAAEELRYTEERATVILISDGKETCDMDPCAVGKTLEEAGVDFTAHVIGFDLADDERQQLQCLAETTGGRYFDAQKAEELKVALAEAVEQVQIQPDQVVAVLAAGTQPLSGVSIEWSAQPVAGGAALSHSGASLSLPPGSGAYSVSARLSESMGNLDVEVVEGEHQQHVLVLDAARLLLKATARGPQGKINDPAVQWAIEDLAAETQAAEASGAEASLYLNSKTYGVFASFEGQTLDQVVRLEPGVQQEVAFDFEMSAAKLEAQDAASIGKTIEVQWEGPDNNGDYLTVVTPDTPDHKHGKYAYTKNGNPAKLPVPDTPGVYELRYISAQSQTALARRPITVTESAVSLNAVDTAPIGKTIDIQWQGPDNKGDYLTVVTPDTPEHKHGKYVYTRHGSPAKLPVPDTPGVYELRYISAQSQIALARRPITVIEAAVSLNAPDTAPIGKTIDIHWQGPDNKGDYLTVVTPDTPEHKHGKYAYTKNGNPAELPVPDTPGMYELRYISAQSQIALARRPITVTEATVNLTASDTAPAGKTIDIQWEGPDNKGDYLTVVTPDTPDHKHGKYVYTRHGSPGKLQIPDQPGVYELRYISAQSQIALARRPITATEVTAKLNALNVVPAKQAIRLEWQGPDNQGDYLTVVTPDTPDNKHGAYVYTKNGDPAKLKMPEQPGQYELRYVMGQSRSVLARRPVKVVSEQELASYTDDAPKAQVKLQVVNAGTGQPVLEGLSWTVYSIQGGNVQNSTDPQPQFSFSPGVYRANVTVGGASKSLDFILNVEENVVRSIIVE